MTTKEDKVRLMKILDMRMLSGFTFDSYDIISLSEKNGGTWRQADGAMQRLRRAGKVAFSRNGRKVVWCALPEAVHALEPTQPNMGM